VPLPSKILDLTGYLAAMRFTYDATAQEGDTLNTDGSTYETITDNH
jgi:hypothetical protein